MQRKNKDRNRMHILLYFVLISLFTTVYASNDIGVLKKKFLSRVSQDSNDMDILIATAQQLCGYDHVDEEFKSLWKEQGEAANVCKLFLSQLISPIENASTEKELVLVYKQIETKKSLRHAMDQRACVCLAMAEKIAKNNTTS